MDGKPDMEGTGFSSGLNGAKQAMDAYGEDLKAAMDELEGAETSGAEPEDGPAPAGAGQEPTTPADAAADDAAAADDTSCRCHDQPPQGERIEVVKDGALPNFFNVVLPQVSKFLEDYGEDLGTALDMLEAEDAAEQEAAGTAAEDAAAPDADGRA